MPSETDLAYAAGLFDGEGCIGIYVRPARSGRSPQHELTLTVKMRDPQAVAFFANVFGGLQKTRVCQGTSVFFVWKAQNKLACELLRQFLPYLKVKKHQAELAIEFQESCVGASRAGLFGRARKLKTEELHMREKFRQALHDAKKENFVCQPPLNVN